MKEAKLGMGVHMNSGRNMKEANLGMGVHMNSGRTMNETDTIGLMFRPEFMRKLEFSPLTWWANGF